MKMKALFDSFTFVIVHDGALNFQLEGASVCTPPRPCIGQRNHGCNDEKTARAFCQEDKSFNKSFQNTVCCSIFQLQGLLTCHLRIHPFEKREKLTDKQT